MLKSLREILDNSNITSILPWHLLVVIFPIHFHGVGAVYPLLVRLRHFFLFLSVPRIVQLHCLPAIQQGASNQKKECAEQRMQQVVCL